MGQKVLITGASGLIGSRLTQLLLARKYEVVHLGRTARQGLVPCFQWNIDRGELDLRALDGVNAIIHLAGAGIADKRWNDQRKREIRESRTRSTRLLFDVLNTARHEVITFVSASAIGYYGFQSREMIFQEDAAPGSDFLASVVKDWEAEVDAIARLDMRVVKIRIGIVLDREGGALKEMMKPIQWWVGAPLASGKQMMSWIHRDDLCNLFAFALEHEQLRGAYNGVAPHPVSNKAFTKLLATVLQKPLWLPLVPGFVVNLLVGEMAQLVTNGSHVDSAKTEAAGFKFQFPELEPALRDLLKA